MSDNTTPKLKLWYAPGACSFGAHAVLIESGLDFELLEVEFGKFTPEFLKLNPKARIPVLAINEEVVTELPAIVTLIALLVPDKHLLGRTPLETARTYEWLNYLSGTLHGQGYGALWRPHRFLQDAALHPPLQEQAKKTIKECYEYVEDRLSRNEGSYAIGNDFTVVDPCLFFCYSWGKRVEIDMAALYPRYTAWWHHVAKRGCITEAQKAHFRVE